MSITLAMRGEERKVSYLVLLEEGADRVLLHRRQRFPHLQKLTGRLCPTQHEASQQQLASAQILQLL